MRPCVYSWWFAVGVCGLLMCVMVETKSGEWVHHNERKYTMKFGNITRRCRLCRPGHMMIEHCTKWRNTRCAPCSKGTYLESSNKCVTCRHCNECEGPGLTIIQNYTAIRQSVCGCLPGYEPVFPGADWCEPLPKCLKGKYRDGYNKCKWHTWCKKGQGVVQRGTPDADTICQRCPDGTFSQRESPKARCQSQPVCIGKPKIQGTLRRKTVCSLYASLPPLTTTAAVFITASSDNNRTGNDTQGFRPDHPKLWLLTTKMTDAIQRPPLNIIVPVTVSNGEDSTNTTTERILPTLQKNDSENAITYSSSTPADGRNGKTSHKGKENTESPGVELGTEKTTEVQHQPTPQLGPSNNNETIVTIVTIVKIVSICGTIVIVSLVLLAVTVVCKCKRTGDNKQVVDQIPLTMLTNQNAQPMNNRSPDNRRQNLHFGNDIDDAIMMDANCHRGQSSSSDQPIGVDMRMTRHDGGTIHTDVVKSSGDDNDSWEGNRPETDIPPNARLKAKSENDSTSSSSPDVRKTRKRRKKPSGSSILQATQYGNKGPSHEGHPLQPPQQQQSLPLPPLPPASLPPHQPALVQEETRESPHKSELVTSGHVTSPESGHRTTHFTLVQGSESGVDSPSSGAMSSEDTSEDERQRPPGNGGVVRASNNNLLSAEDEANIPNKDSTGASANGACGGTSKARFNGVNVETTGAESAAAQYSGEENIPPCQLTDIVNFEADIATLIAEGLDSRSYLIFLKHIDHPEDSINTNSTVHDYLLNFLCSWWQNHHAIGAILMALKKSGNGRLRDDIIKKFCKLD